MSQALPEEKINYIINTYQNFKNKPVSDYKQIENKIIEDLKIIGVLFAVSIPKDTQTK